MAANLTPETIDQSLDTLVTRARAGSDDWPALYREFDAVEASVFGEGGRRQYRWTQDTRDKEAEAKVTDYREHLLPVFESGAASFVGAMLQAHDLTAIDEAFGPQLLRLLRTEVARLEPRNKALRLQERQLANDYTKHIAAGAVTVGGEELTLSQAKAKASSEDPTLRKEAWLAWRGWFLEHHNALAEIFDGLVRTRQAMAATLDDDNYLPLGYAGMGRTDYGPEQSAAFRDAVEAYAVPVLRKLRQGQAAALGTPTLAPWDVGYHPKLSLNAGVALPIEDQLDKAEQLFSRLSPKLAAHFRNLRDAGRIDLENRPGKAAGAYCTAFHDENVVAVFCNSVGDESDIRTLTHEMGHAFQCLESLWVSPTKLRWPTMDAAELHSMGMEYLSLDLMDAFFSPEDAEVFGRARWRRGVELLCYVACVDAFQHWVYTHPESSADERDAAWARFADQYDAGVDWGGEAASFRSTRWYAQLHIFQYPFYYIDYALAELGAMQLAVNATVDRAKALETYLDLCRLGGTGSMLELVDKAGLSSPFEPATLKRLMAHASEVLAEA